MMITVLSTTFWPYNLITNTFVEAFEDRENPIDAPITADQEKGLEFALNSLRPLEKDVLLRYFRDEQTQKEIGDALGYTGAYIGQTIRHAQRKLRKPGIRQAILLGYELSQKLSRVQQLEEELERRMASVSLAHSMLDALEKKISSVNMYVADAIASGVLGAKMTIETLELSTRAYNCLTYGGIKTVLQLMGMSYQDLLDLPKVGYACADEIVEKLKEHTGFEIRKNNQ